MATRKKKASGGIIEWLSGLHLIVKIAIGAITILGLYGGYSKLQESQHEKNSTYNESSERKARQMGGQ